MRVRCPPIRRCANRLERVNPDGCGPACGDRRAEDVARLLPLVYEHINMLGRYSFSVPEAVTRGELRAARS